jgi:hypothetical protein
MGLFHCEIYGCPISGDIKMKDKEEDDQRQQQESMKGICMHDCETFKAKIDLCCSSSSTCLPTHAAPFFFAFLERVSQSDSGREITFVPLFLLMNSDEKIPSLPSVAFEIEKYF